MIDRDLHSLLSKSNCSEDDIRDLAMNVLHVISETGRGGDLIAVLKAIM